MKALKLSTLVLLLASVFSSCTKDNTTPTKPTGATDATGRDKATASIINFDINPKPVYVSSTVEVTGTLLFTKAVNKFNVILQKSTTQDASGNWINFEDTEYKENVDLGFTGPNNNKVYTTATTFPFKYSFPASELGVSKTGWRVHVVGGEVDNAFLGNATLEILPDPACVQTFTIDKDVKVEDNHDGTYNFIISYTLTSPVDVADVKFQGGATSGGQFEHELIESELKNLVVLHNNKQNTVLKWEGNLTKCTPYTVSFKYKRKFSCPATDATITGDWKATTGATELGSIAPLKYSCQ